MTEPPFTGTVAQTGSQFVNFQISAAGTVTATLTSLAVAGSPSTIMMGMGIGSQAVGPNGLPTCTLAVTGTVQSGQALTASANGAVAACASIYDLGNIPTNGSADFSISITHP